MTQDEIYEMARQASTEDETTRSDKKITLYAAKTKNFLERFAKLVAAKAFQDGYEKGVAVFNEAVWIEREACAKVIESHGETLANGAMLADAIRARGEA